MNIRINVLEAIDYKTVGEIVEEKVDEGDGIFAPSYINSRCKQAKGYRQINCQLSRTSVHVFYMKKENIESNIESVIVVTDGSSGRNN